MQKMATTNDPLMPERSLATDPASQTETARGYQIVAMFDSFERARAARDRLIEEGIPRADMDIINRDAEPGHSSIDYERNEEGFWGAVKRFFVPDEHATGYTEGLRRGHAMLVVRPPFEQHDRIVEILEGYDPIDFDAQEEEWRRSGWTGTAPTSSATETTTDLGTASTLRSTETTTDLGTAAAQPVVPQPVARPLTAETRAERTAERALGTEADRALGTESEAIPVVEEQIRVGKRVIDRGGVRVRTYVLERPVEQDVTLHEERVQVERRPVDRPVGTVPADAFRERSIEVTASGEEAIIQKDARVIEEVVVRKEAEDRTETVRDTVRKTEVEVEDTTRPRGTTSRTEATPATETTETTRTTR
jgi:uncharacterized protein (TIGR02271 family)